MITARTLRDGDSDKLKMEKKPNPKAYDAWFCAETQEALDDPRPAIPHEKVEAYFAKRRAASLFKIQQRDS
jgi:DNA-damage-inducible protein J